MSEMTRHSAGLFSSMQFPNGDEAAALEQFADQDAEPDFDPVQPGSVFRRVFDAA
jgi:hypothetical protein